MLWPPSVEFDNRSTSWLSCLFDCCGVAQGCRDRCGRNNLCRKSRICVWSLVCWSCWLLSAGASPYFCIHQLLFPCLEVLVQSASPHHAVGCRIFPGLAVDVKYFHVSLADILVPHYVIHMYWSVLDWNCYEVLGAKR